MSSRIGACLIAEACSCLCLANSISAIDIGSAQNPVTVLSPSSAPEAGQDSAHRSPRRPSPHVILRFGQLSAKFHAAEQFCCGPHGCSIKRRLTTDHRAGRRSGRCGVSPRRRRTAKCGNWSHENRNLCVVWRQRHRRLPRSDRLPSARCTGPTQFMTRINGDTTAPAILPVSTAFCG